MFKSMFSLSPNEHSFRIILQKSFLSFWPQSFQTFPLLLVSIRLLVASYTHTVTDIQLFCVFINLLQAMIFFF